MEPEFTTSDKRLIGRAATDLFTAAGRLNQHVHTVCARFGITHDQYTVLLLLKGAYPKGRARHEVAGQLAERAPDVTRLIDRLEQNGLVERYRSDEDRRLSFARISRMGIVLLEQMEEPICAARDAYMERLTADDLLELTRLCARLHASA